MWRNVRNSMGNNGSMINLPRETIFKLVALAVLAVFMAHG